MSKELKRLEKKIDDNVFANGQLLLKIRDEKLYKVELGTFEDYLEVRWGWSKQHGYRLIASAELAKKMLLNTTKTTKKVTNLVTFLPSTESQSRALIDGLNTDSERVAVWDKVKDDAKKDGVKITAALITEKVNDFKNSGAVAPEIDFVELERKQAEQLAEFKAAKAAKEEKKIADEEPELMSIIDDLNSMNKQLTIENGLLKKIVESNEGKANILSLTTRLYTAQTNLNKALRKIDWMKKRLIPLPENERVIASNEVDCWE